MKERILRIEDALNSTRAALQNAGSIASMLLTTEAVVADIPEEENIGDMGMGGMPGMM
ncbi:MAG TPA: hypothetical protein H9808_07700 [Candidatus Atopostipes pullistercoris]|uniref:Molecular chaperone GroEL n=1 Tax=Candidatus Atopostipes pullistercoris TaxID=2838467 RepID=A0A9D2G3A5_9LACT|nr:hypothetical protein [Candidatus Atopostipes pullistercoris]